MSNTIIQLKYSTETGNVPVDLANGELAINHADGKLFFLGQGGVTYTDIYSGPGGLDTEIQFNDSGILNGNSGLTFDKTTATLTVGTTNVTGRIEASYTHANGAFDKANDVGTFSQSAYDAANAALGATSTPFTANSYYYNGTGSTSVFYSPLDEILSANNTMVTLDGLIQVPGLHYVTSANAVSFYSTPTLNTVIEIRTLQNLASGVEDQVGASQSESIAYAIALGG